jgi:hypothetical protein
VFIGRNVASESGDVRGRNWFKDVLSVLLGWDESPTDQLQGYLVLDSRDGHVFGGTHSELDHVRAVEFEAERELPTAARQKLLGHATVTFGRDIG